MRGTAQDPDNKNTNQKDSNQLDLLVIGDCSVDLYMDVEDSSVLPNSPDNKNRICFLHGTKIPVVNFSSNLAGNSTHVGVASARLGLKAGIYTELGNDDNGKKFLALFENEDINTEFVELNDQYNTNIHTIIWHAGERTIFSYHEKVHYGLDFDRLPKPKWIYYTSLAEGFEDFQQKLSNYIDKNPDVLLAFNPGSTQMKKGVGVLKNILERTSILFVNKEEAERLTETRHPELGEELHRELEKLGPKMTVITNGKDGASAHSENEFIFMPALKLTGPVVDKTGAGDTYAASFLSAIAKSKSMKTAMEWGNKNSANTLGYIGCINGLLTLEQIQ